LLLTVFADPGQAMKSPLFFLPHLVLCALAARSGLFAASTAALVLTTGTLLATAFGVGAFYRIDGSDGMGQLVAYVCSLLAIPMVATALTGEIAANERRWQMALDVSKIGVGEWDLDTGRIDFSPRWLALLGHRSQSFGHSLSAFWAMIHPDDLRSVRDAVDLLRSGEPSAAMSSAACNVATAAGSGSSSMRSCPSTAPAASRCG